METIEKRSKNKTREQLAEMFVKSLSEQKLPWYAVWNTYPQQNAVTAKAYRGINAFLLSMVAEAFGYDDPRWCTFNQAKKKGWHIKEGSKGVPVEFWSAINIHTKEVMDFREAAQKIRDGEAEQGDFRYYNRNFYVFNAAQIEGIPELKRASHTVDIDLIRRNRDTLIKNMAVGFDGNGTDCHYSPSKDEIVMPPEGDFRDTYGYMCSFLHEAGHATGAPSRLGRSFGSTKEEYAIEELRTEIASAMTSQQLGIPSTEKQMQRNLDLHKAYIQGWAQAIQNAPKVLFDAIKDAEQISDYLIEKSEFRQVIEAEQVKEPEKAAAPEKPIRELTELQKQSAVIAQKYELLSMQEKIDLIAQSFGATTGKVITKPCSGKWRGTSDMSIGFDNGISLAIGNERTTAAKTLRAQRERVTSALQAYNSEIIEMTKAAALSALLEREKKDNAIAAQKGLRPYRLLNVEFNGADNHYLGWYYVTLEVGGQIISHMDTGLYYDISNGRVGSGDEEKYRAAYYPAGSLKEADVDYVFHNVGFSSRSDLYTLPLADDVRRRAELTLAKRLIDDYCLSEFKSHATFDDLRSVGIGYTTITDEEIPVQAIVNLEDFRIERFVGTMLVETRQYSTLAELIHNELEGLDFSDLIYATDEEIAQSVRVEGKKEEAKVQNKVQNSEKEEPVKRITVLVVEPGKEPYTKEIGDDWQAFQAEVGGIFQVVYPDHNPVGLVCNDEGKMLGLPLNRGLRDDAGDLYDIIAGTFFLVGLGGGGATVSLTDDQIRKYEQRFHDPEQFVKVNGKLACIPSSKDPDLHKTGERVSTPRGSFAVTSLTREQMEAAGYGCHHRSEDGKYLIMGDGTRAFAVAAEAPELKKELPQQELSFCHTSNHYYAKVQTEKGVEQCAMQFRPGRYFFETAAGKVHMLTPAEVERYMKFVAEEVNLEAVRQQMELLRQKTAGQIEQRNKTI